MPRFLALALLLLMPMTAMAETTPPATNAFSFEFTDLTGKELPLEAYRGKVLLIVNTATGCGFAGHFHDLQKLSDTYKDQGLVVIGVPSNDFGGQEPLDGDALLTSVSETYSVTFPLTSKQVVSGTAAHPFYRWAAQQNVGNLLTNKPRWNFHKYLVGRDGRLLASEGPTTAPKDAGFVKKIESALAIKSE